MTLCFLSHLLWTPPHTLIFQIIFPSATILSLLVLLPHLSCNTLPPSSQLHHSFFHHLPILWNQNKFNEVSSVNGLSDFTFDLMICIKLCPKDLLGLLRSWSLIIWSLILSLILIRKIIVLFILYVPVILVPNFLLLPLSLLNLLFISPWVLIQVIIIPSVLSLSLSLHVLSLSALWSVKC